MTDKYYFTSESVTEGHPDKICDQISDAILDNLLEQDPDAHAAIEVLTTTGTVHVAGEITTTGYADIQKSGNAKEIGYTNPATASTTRTRASGSRSTGRAATSPGVKRPARTGAATRA
jgi:S-adenosylmethionine synthetase